MPKAAPRPPTELVTTRVAQRVRRLRTELGYSLDALAQRCEVSRSMLSLIERGETNPSAVVLEKLATGLGVPLASLFDDTTAPPHPVARRGDREAWRDPASGYVRRNISPPSFPSPIRIVEVVLPAGARVAYETGARDVVIHQQVWVLDGAIEVTDGDVVHRLAKDDCLAMQLREPVGFRNRTRAPARYAVVIVAPRQRAPRRSP
jgi:transcriptional regulator with XRE-family HTH domain